MPLIRQERYVHGWSTNIFHLEFMIFGVIGTMSGFGNCKLCLLKLKGRNGLVVAIHWFAEGVMNWLQFTKVHTVSGSKYNCFTKLALFARKINLIFRHVYRS